jgi:putative membrane protein
MLGALALYWRAWRRHRPARELSVRERRQPWWFVAGVATLWVASDWPVGALGAGYLASFHMLQFMLYTLVAAPLLLIGIPEWFLATVRHRPVWRVVAGLSRPLLAGILFNVVLLTSHTPVLVDLARPTQMGSFLMDAVWLAAGLVLWLPLCNPDSTLRHRSYAVQATYLFLASGVFPMLPGAFLVFAESPLYRIFELAPPVLGLSASTDQQLAGLIMKVGNIPILWPVLLVLFLRWARVDREATPPPRPAVSLDAVPSLPAPAAAAAANGNHGIDSIHNVESPP